jgi:hypothetical protein
MLAPPGCAMPHNATVEVMDRDVAPGGDFNADLDDDPTSVADIH